MIMKCRHCGNEVKVKYGKHLMCGKCGEYTENAVINNALTEASSTGGFMKVFKVNEFDWVCAENEEKAKEFYLELTELDEEEAFDDFHECNLEKESMWYGFDGDGLREFLKDKKDKEFIICADPSCDYDCVVKLAFKDILDIEHVKEPYIIASTEC